jgi:hypothetical protein
MKPVIVVLTGAEHGGVEADVAEALGEVLNGQVRHFPPLDLRNAAADLALPETAVGVLALGAGNEQAWWTVLARCHRPLAVIPSRSTAPPKISRVLMPLAGAAPPESELNIARMLAAGGVDLTALHVFERPAAPLFWDQAAHADQVWGAEFLARYCDIPGVPLELRSGPVAAQLLEAAANLPADLILMSWQQILAPGRAQVVRATVDSGNRPVLLIPASSSWAFGP